MIEISTAEQLYNIRNDLTADYVLTGDIDLSAYGSSFNSGKGWIPIGDETHPFTGTFDGCNYKISNLYINVDQEDNSNIMGLFRNINSAVIQNVIIYNSYMFTNTGAFLVGHTSINSTISNCHIRNSFMGGRGDAGITVFQIGGLIEKCSAVFTARVQSCATAGIVYSTFNAEIQKTWSMVDIQIYAIDQWMADSYCAFGVITEGSTISNCYSLGVCYGGYGMSGFFQIVKSTEENNLINTITNCYSAVKLMTNKQYQPYPHNLEDPMFGGFISEINEDVPDIGHIVSNCFWDMDVAGHNRSVAGTAKTTTQMKTQATYSGYDFSNVWEMKGMGYPLLIDNEQTIFWGMNGNCVPIILDRDMTIKTKLMNDGFEDSDVVTKSYTVKE